MDVLTKPAVVEKTAAQLLYDAADYINEHGLHQGWFHRYEDLAEPGDVETWCGGPVCTSGALNVAEWGWPVRVQLLRGGFTAEAATARESLALSIGMSGYDPDTRTDAGKFWYASDTIVAWNDEPGRTKDEVVEMLRQAARTTQ